MVTLLDNWSHFTTPLEGLSKHSLVCIGAGEQSGSWRGFRGRRLRHPALVLVSVGSGWYVDATSPTGIAIEAPHALWLSPGVEHGYGPAPSGWSEHWLIFGGRGVAAYTEIGVLSQLSPVIPLSRSILEVLPLFSTLRTAIHDTTIVGQLETSVLAQRIIAGTVRAHYPTTGAPPEKDLLHRLALQAFETLSVSERARQLGLSVEELRREVARQTGLTPLEYVLDRRVARACELLTSSNETITRIARGVGYTDAAYFSRLFSERVGMSPRRFREQQSRT
ncbi:helix-turn-helix domain-containing protein [Microcella sp.]|uniref:helix-turn-helix domain-containing protein n=1 Tax=Microcella sp. TaxID=1913979 RepID=UPI003F6F524C